MTGIDGDRGRRRLYRARDGKILGVCAGVARYMEAPVGTVRGIAVLLLIFLGVWPVLVAYVVAGFVMRPEPARPIETEEEQEFYDSYTGSRRMALHRLERTFGRLDRRVRRMEVAVTAAEYDWDRRMKAE